MTVQLYEYKQTLIEPSHDIMVLFVLHKLIFNMHAQPYSCV